VGEKKSITRKLAGKYRQADRRGNQAILNDFVRLAEYHRKYAIRLLANWARKSCKVEVGEAHHRQAP